MMSPEPVSPHVVARSSRSAIRRRASERASTRALARVECWDLVGGFRVGDVSFGGIRLIGKPEQVGAQVGDRVRVLLAIRADGRDLELDAWGEVRRVSEQELGVAWNVTNPVTAETIAYWVAACASEYDEYQVSATRS